MFFQKLLAATAQGQIDLASVPQIQDGLAGKISLATYIAYLTEAYHHVKHTVPLMQAAKAVRSHVEDNFDYVGDRFADEARKIHKGQAEDRGIYGEATGQEIKALAEEGVPVAPLPNAPPEKKDLN